MKTDEIKNSLIVKLGKKGSSIIMHYGEISLEEVNKILNEISELTVVKFLEDSNGILVKQQLGGKKGWRTINVEQCRLIVARLLGA